MRAEITSKRKILWGKITVYIYTFVKTSVSVRNSGCERYVGIDVRLVNSLGV